MQLESKKITLPGGREHHVPALPEGANRPGQIPVDFFLQRMEVVYKAMRRVIEELTRKGHNQSKGKEELALLEKLKGEVYVLINTFDPIASIGALDRLCGELHSGPVRAYKSNPEQQKVFKILLNQLLDSERNAIEEVFNLPRRFRSANGEPADVAGSVDIQPHPDEVQMDTAEALEDRVRKNPDHYLALEKAESVLRNEFGTIIADLRRVEDIQAELKEKLNIIRGSEDQVKRAIEVVKQQAGEIENTLRVVPTPDVLKGLPTVLKDATTQVYDKWIALFLLIARYQMAGKGMKEGIDQFKEEQEAFLQTIASGHGFIEKFSKAKAIFSHEFFHFHALEATFEGLTEEVVNVSDAVKQSKKALTGLLGNKKIRKLLPKVLPFVDDGRRMAIQELFQLNHIELNGKAPNGAAKEEPTADKKPRIAIFTLKTKTPEEIRDEALKRMGAAEPAVHQLYGERKIEKLIELCADFGRTQLQKMGINQSWFIRFELDIRKGKEERVKLFTLLFQQEPTPSAQ